MDLIELERVLMTELGLSSRPVAVSFWEQPARTEDRYQGAQPAGCSFWRLAAEGQSCFTAPENHYNCAIGCHTHNIPLPEERKHELGDTLDLMSTSGYLNLDEVPSFARLDQTPQAVVYRPLSDADESCDLAIIVASGAAIMLLQEAAIRARAPVSGSLLGRPTCMMLPAALKRGLTISLACIGNRIYTETDNASMYAALPLRDLFSVADLLPTITAANAKLGEYHRSRRSELGSP